MPAGFYRLRPLFALLMPLFLSACSSSAGPGGTGTAVNPVSAEAAADGKRFIVLMNNNSPFWDAVRVGVEQAGKELGVNATLDTNDGTPQGQLNKLRQYGSQTDIAGVAISVAEADNIAIAEEMQKLREQGVHVITIDSDVNRENYPDARYAFIGTNNYEAGVELGKAIKGLRPDGGKYVTFVGLTGAQNAVERISGVKEGAGEKFEAVTTMADQTDPSKARQNVRDAMTNYPDVNTLVGIWSYNAPAIVDVVKEKQNRDQYTIAVFDAEPQAIEAMADGNIDVMLVQNPYDMGYQGIKLLKALAADDKGTLGEMYPNYGQPGGDVYDTGLKIVVPSEQSALQKEMFGQKTEFMPLAQFRDWLKQYGLIGS